MYGTIEVGDYVRCYTFGDSHALDYFVDGVMMGIVSTENGDYYEVMVTRAVARGRNIDFDKDKRIRTPVEPKKNISLMESDQSFLELERNC